MWGGQGILVKSIVASNIWGYARNVFASAYSALPDYANTGPSGTTLAKARSLISQAGAHGAKGGIMVTTQLDGQQAQAIQAAPAQIGLELSVNMVTLAAETAATQDRQHHPYDMVISMTTPDFPDPANLPHLLYSVGFQLFAAVSRHRHRWGISRSNDPRPSRRRERERRTRPGHGRVVGQCCRCD